MYIREKFLRENCAWLSRLTQSLLKLHPAKISQIMKRRRCGWSDSFLLQVLLGKTTEFTAGPGRTVRREVIAELNCCWESSALRSVTQPFDEFAICRQVHQTVARRAHGLRFH